MGGLEFSRRTGQSLAGAYGYLKEGTPTQTRNVLKKAGPTLIFSGDGKGEEAWTPSKNARCS
jgi:hypothetical protein